MYEYIGNVGIKKRFEEVTLNGKNYRDILFVQIAYIVAICEIT